MNFINTLVQTVKETVVSNPVHTARSATIRSALTSVANVHPDYRDIGFDEQFIENKAAALMAPFLNGGPAPEAEALAAAWATQFRGSEQTIQKAISNVTPMVTDFVNLIASEPSNVQPAAMPITAPVQRYGTMPNYGTASQTA